MLRRVGLVVVVLAVGGCGRGEDRPNVAAGLVLDGAPAAVHVGIYVAERRGFDEAEGVSLRVRPGARPDSGLAALRRGRTPFAVVDLHDLAVARERGDDFVAVMSLAQLPIPERARQSAAGDADVRAAPPYPELVLAARRATLTEQPALVRAAVAGIARGYREELSDPEAALGAMPARLDRRTLAAQLDDVEDTFTGTTGQVGAFDRAALERWAAWEARAGIAKEPPDVARMFPAVPTR